MDDLLALVEALRAYNSMVNNRFNFSLSEDQKRYVSMMDRLKNLLDREKEWYENTSQTQSQYSEKLRDFD